MIGLILGLIFGVAAGALLTPRSGPENRSLVREQLPPWAPEALDRAAEEAKARIQLGREAFTAGAAEARSRLIDELERSRRH